MGKKPYITDEQINKCVLLGILIHYPVGHNRHTPFTATKGDRFISKTDDTGGAFFSSVDEIINLLASKKEFYVSSFPHPKWSWNECLEYNLGKK